MSDHRKARDQGEPLNSDDVLELSASDESEPEEEPRDAPFDPELDHSDDDGDVMTSTSASAPSAQSTFTLSGGSSGFSYRSRNIFDCLDTVEKRSIPSSNHGNSAESRKTSHPPSTSPVPVKKSAVPDYLVHPERWTRYSLEDVVESSDQDNRRVAFQFLSSLQRETKSDPPRDIKEKMIFSRPKRLPKDLAAVQLSPDLQGKEKELQLSHLEEEEDNEEREQAEAGEQITGKTREEETSKEKTVSGPVAQEEEEKKLKESSANFASFRKTKVKNYRKSSADKED